jgi:hypothetical protein
MKNAAVADKTCADHWHDAVVMCPWRCYVEKKKVNPKELGVKLEAKAEACHAELGV